MVNFRLLRLFVRRPDPSYLEHASKRAEMSVEISWARMPCRRFQAIVLMLAVKDSAVGVDDARCFSESAAFRSRSGVAGGVEELRWTHCDFDT